MRKPIKTKTPVKQLTGADVEKQLALAQRIEERLQTLRPTRQEAPPVAKNETFKVSPEDGRQMTACDSGDERSFMQWVFNKAHGVLSPKNGEINDSKVWLLEVMRAALLSSKPKTPIEALLVSQCLTTHELAMEFAARAMRSDDLSLSSKLSARYCQLANLACAQAETIQRIRGEAGRQSVTVEHLSVSEGGRAVVGQIHATTPGRVTET